LSSLGPSNKKNNEISIVETNNLTTDQIDLVKNLRDKPTLAAKVLLGVDLEWYQAEAIEDVWRKRFSIFCWSRQIGKTFLEAVLFSLLCILYPNEDAVFIAPSLRQAMNPFNYVRDFYNSHAVFRSMIRGKMTKTKVEFKNSSTITPLPMGDGCVAEALLMRDTGLFYIEDAAVYGRKAEEILAKDLVMGENGYNKTAYYFYNGYVPIRIVKTKRGYQLKSSLIHPVRIIRNKKNDWVRAQDLQKGDKVIIDRGINWFPNVNNITYDEAYCAGAMIGDGCFTNQYKLGFANAKKDHAITDCLVPVLQKITGKELKTRGDVHSALQGKDQRKVFLNYFGFPNYEHQDERAYAKNKSIPSKILSCSKEAMRGFLQGLFDTDGHVSESKKGDMREVGLTNTSERLVREVQSILLKFGIVSSLNSRQRKNKNWNRVYELKITGQDLVLFAQRIGFRLSRKQKQLEEIVAKSKRNYSLTDQIYHIGDRLLAVELQYGFASQYIIDKSGHTLWGRLADRTRQGKGITYYHLELFLEAYKDINIPELEYLRDVYNKHYYYDEIVSLEESEADTYDAYIPDDHTFWSNGFISHNSKILGTHASIIGIDEYATFSKEFIDTVVMPMANRKKNPSSRGNRLSIIGTPLSKANHYYTEYMSYMREQTKNPNGDYHVSKYTFMDSDNQDLHILLNAAKSMPFERFCRENLAEFMSNIGGFFSEELLRQAEDLIDIEFRGEEGGIYTLGIDPPSVNNMGGFVILKLVNNCKEAEVVFCLGIPAGYIPFSDLRSLTVRLIRLFNIQRLHIDQGGGGLQLAQSLYSPDVIVDEFNCPLDILIPPPLPDGIIDWKGSRNPNDEISMMDTKRELAVIHTVPFSPQAKSAMYFNVKNAMQQGALKIPKVVANDKRYIEAHALQNEMEGLKSRLTPASYLSLSKADDQFDDRVDALVLAYDAALSLLQGTSGATKVGGRSHDDDYNRNLGGFNFSRTVDFPDRSRNDPWGGGRDW